MRTFAPTREECATRLGNALREHIRNTKLQRKVFARSVGENHRTIQNWMYCGQAPPINKLVVLMAEAPSLCDELMALVDEVRKTREDNNK